MPHFTIEYSANLDFHLDMAKVVEKRAQARVSKVEPPGPHGSQGDAKHRPETALKKRLLTMRVQKN